MSDWLANTVQLLTGAQGLWSGVAPVATQRIYFANHSSHLDALVLWAALPDELRPQVRPVAALDYWGSGFKAKVASRFRAVLIKRARDNPNDDPLAPLDEALQRGDSLIFFPEGTRSLDGELQPFKSGLFRLATRHPQVELVPVYLENLNRILPKGTMLPVPLPGAVIFGAPLERIADEPKEAFLTRSREAVLALQRQ
jgi:1-acyl-sn-glycerol-3-phosphate acyltransferase